VLHRRRKMRVIRTLFVEQCWSRFLRREQALDGFSESGIGLSAHDRPVDLHPQAPRFEDTQEEGRRPTNARLSPFVQVATDRFGMPPFVQALPELRQIKTQCLSMLRKRFGIESTLMLEESRVHLPESPLLRRAASCFRGLECLRMRGQGEVAHHVSDLPCPNVVPFDLRQRLSNVSRAERTLVIGEFDEHHASRWLPFHGAPSTLSTTSRGSVGRAVSTAFKRFRISSSCFSIRACPSLSASISFRRA
jgi:hypothetical protein